ncbi:helix-turn-helix domain-containing protein [Biomaibacter acetigenes]|uniref:Helix-turn-helix domain-containing protein n=2 Tax=Biomaibacter acetigenes TaxID=2316383 RepID=A0A3G2R4S8_9FIRM|nr:helix-turn-helix domain-containing protein [Biomaibacter acetigenes]
MLFLLLPGKYKTEGGVKMNQSIQEINGTKELGNFLRQAREEKGIQQELIQQVTKIRMKYLQAIENGEFSAIPGGDVYVKGFLKSYAEAVGLEPSTILQQYKKISATKISETQEENPISSIEPSDNENINTMINFKFIGVLVLIIVFGVLLFYGVKFFQNKPAGHLNTDMNHQITPPMQSTDSIPQTNIPEETSTQTKKTMVELVEDTPEKTVYTVWDKIIEVNLEITRDRCWISVKKDGEAAYEGTLRSGDTKSWTASEELVIRVGNPPVVKLKINGQDFGVMGGKTRNIIFKRGD